jgi:hypothetical protein
VTDVRNEVGQERRAAWAGILFAAAAVFELMVVATTIGRAAPGVPRSVGNDWITPFGQAASSIVLVSVFAATLVLWWASRGGEGRRLFAASVISWAILWTFELGARAALFERTWMAGAMGTGASGVSASPSSAMTVIALTAVAVAQLLLSLGLIRSPYVPRWVGWLALTVSFLGVIAVVGGLRHFYPSSVGSASGAMLRAVLFAILAWRFHSLVERPERARMRVVGVGIAAGLLAMFVASLACSVMMTQMLSRASSFTQRPSAYEEDYRLAEDAAEPDWKTVYDESDRVIGKLCDGFDDPGMVMDAMPDSVRSVVGLDLSRGESSLQMGVQLVTSTEGSGSPRGYFHGPALEVGKADGETWYTGDNYFLDLPGSRYASIPRSQKLALWDAVGKDRASEYPESDLVLGVFRGDELKDKRIVAQDGYRPEDVTGAWLVVTTPDSSSDVADGIEWRGADQLITAARKYEQDAARLDDSEDAEDFCRVDVTAYRYDDGAWHQVPKRR